MNPSQVSLDEIGGQKESVGKKYVLVEESRLSELSKFEDILREEKDKLGEQCAWILSDVQTKVNEPIPATRLAMHNMCESSKSSFSYCYSRSFIITCIILMSAPCKTIF